MSDISTLYRLQQLDIDIEKINHRLQEVKGILEDDRVIQEAKSAMDKADEDNISAQKSLKEAEDIRNGIKIQLEQMESNLYGGKFHNPKELQDIQNDVTSLKRRLAHTEDNEINAMLLLEKTEKEKQISIENYGSITSCISEQNRSLSKEYDELERNLGTIRAERQVVLSSLSAELISLYDSLRQKNRGIAVTSLADGSCSACGASLTPAQIQITRQANEVTFCPSCGRILYGG